MKILLATLHAKYVHSSLALPCLAAACREVEGVTTVIREYTVNEPQDQVLCWIVAEQADVAAFSCYIWNIGATLKIAADLKKLLPQTFIILGGPEVSHGVFELLEKNPAINCVIRGEGEETFRECIAALRSNHSTTQPLNHSTTRPLNDSTTQLLSDIPGLTFRAGEEIVATPERSPMGELDAIPSPFAAGLVDLAKPLVYYETSRGCPFSCAFCMSSLEKGVRSFSPERIEADLALLMESGVQTVKLVDRTFNYDAGRANAIWRFILARNRESRFHFEIAADLLTEENLLLLAEVPAGMFRFEIGVQSGEEETLARVSRHSDVARLFANVRRLVETTGITVHLDLVAGLPHEDFAGFLRSLQRLFDVLSNDNSYFFDCQGGKEEATEAYRTVRRGASDAANAGRRKKTDCHIQVEPLKVLKGAPMRRIAREEGYLHSDTPPYKILRTPWLSFEEISRIEAIARLLDLVYNSGRFGATLEALGELAPLSEIFSQMASFREGEDGDGQLSREGVFELLWRFAESEVAETGREAIREALCYDFCLADYPSGKLPVFFGAAGAPARWDKGELERIVQRLGIGKGSRVRGFVRKFARDYRRHPWREGELELLFVYISAPGKGFRVEVVERE